MIKVETHDFGVQCLLEDYIVFFGHQKGSSENLKRAFPHLEPKSVKQVHGDKVVKASDESVEADALYTDESHQSLIIKTADCLPIFVVDPKHKTIVGIHAGWRGVASQIATKALTPLLERGGQPKDFQVVIGPHIRLPSFEVHEPVWVQLMDSVPITFNHELKSFYETLPETKYRVNLEKIVRAQLQDFKVPNERIHSIEIDTVADREWHSFRRDAQNSGRNLSFIARFR